MEKLLLIEIAISISVLTELSIIQCTIFNTGNCDLSAKKGANLLVFNSHHFPYEPQCRSMD